MSSFKKKAAGPYADEVRYKGGEPIAKKNKYIFTSTTKDGTCFSKGSKIDDALKYIEKWQIQQDIDWLYSMFRFCKVDELELYATVDMAICDLRNSGIDINVASVKDLISSNSQWKNKLSKKFFSDEHIERAIRKCYEFFGS